MFNKLANLSLTVKFASIVFAGIVILFLIASIFILGQQKDTTDDVMNGAKSVIASMLESNIKDKTTSEKQNAEQIAELLAAIAPTAMAELDLTALSGFAEVVAKNSSISYVGFLNGQGKTFAEEGTLDAIPPEQVVTKVVSAEGMSFGKVIVAYNLISFNQHLSVIKKDNQNQLFNMERAMDESLQTSKVSLWMIMVVIGLLVSAMVYSVFKVIVLNRLEEMVDRLHEINQGDGDLTERVNVQGNDEIDKLATNFNDFLVTVHSTITQVKSVLDRMNLSSEHMESFTTASKDALGSQQVEIEQVASAINQMSATVQEVARSAASAADSANNADSEASNGQLVVENTISAITTLAEQVNNASEVINKVATDGEQIGAILDVIRSIADQTNLLALNAAIEAARAGEQGRGFAVVADEVRTLASRTQQSTEEIHQMIEKLQSGTSAAVKVMEVGKEQTIISVETAKEAGTTLNTIKNAITEISDMNAQIASAAEQQSAVSDEINKNIANINDSANVLMDGSAKCAENSQDLSNLAIELNTLVNKFKV